MLKFFKKNSEEEKKVSFVRGLSYGLGGALVLLIIVLLVVFGPKIKDKISGNDSDSPTNIVSADASELRITILTSEKCGDKCFDINLFLDALRQNDIKELGLETLNIESDQGKKLADKYAISKVPTVLIAGELDKNPQLAQAWSVLGEIIDDVFVFRQLIPPYVDVATGEIRGQFSLVYLVDESCDNCYDVNLHNTALGNLGLNPENSSIVDVGSDDGDALISKYNITKVPTILMMGELSEYSGLQQIWDAVGSVADDGTYVFTGMEEMGTYRDLDTGNVVVVEVQAPPTDIVQ